MHMTGRQSRSSSHSCDRLNRSETSACVCLPRTVGCRCCHLSTGLCAVHCCLSFARFERAATVGEQPLTPCAIISSGTQCRLVTGTAPGSLTIARGNAIISATTHPGHQAHPDQPFTCFLPRKRLRRDNDRPVTVRRRGVSDELKWESYVSNHLPS